MFYASLIFFLVLPLFGVMAMEGGEESAYVDAVGTANGASIAYALHIIAFLLAFLVTMRGLSSRRVQGSVIAGLRTVDVNLDAYAFICALTFTLLAFLMVFVFHGLDVLSLNVDKAEFRVTLGPFGGIMTLATKWLMPAMFAALVFAIKQSTWTFSRRLWVVVSAVCLIIVGASWGFKTTVLFMLLPTLIVCAWKIRLRTLAGVGIGVAGLILAGAIYFDRSDGAGSAVEALILRLTTLQGDLAWYTWEKVSQAAATPPYWRTFLPIVGDRMLEWLTGANAARDYADWASYYFGPAMTIWGGYPADAVARGVTTQPTLFGEVLVVGGKYFFLFVSAAFGLLTAIFGFWTKRAIEDVRPDAAATLATFFSLTLLPWTLGNGIASLAYLINLVGAAITYLTIHAFFHTRPTRELAHRA